MRFVTRAIHGYLDNPVAISVMVLPFVLGRGAGNTLFKRLAVATVLLVTLLSMHRCWRRLRQERKSLA